MDDYAIASAIVQGLPQEVLEHHMCSITQSLESEPPGRCIDDVAVEALADRLQEIIAYVVSDIIDAGSEREVILEDEQLALALRTTLKDW